MNFKLVSVQKWDTPNNLKKTNEEIGAEMVEKRIEKYNET